MIWWVMGPLGLTLGVGAAWGPLGLLLLAGQAMVGCFLLEVINYVQVHLCGLSAHPPPCIIALQSWC